MAILCLDVESRPQDNLIDTYLGDIKAPSNYKDTEKISAYLENAKKNEAKNMATSPHWADIVCIGVKEDDKDTVQFTDFLTFFEYYKELKKRATDGIRLVGFCSKNFDIPLLISQGVKYGINSTILSEWRRGCRAYSTDFHVDLYEVINPGKPEGKGKHTLSKFAKIYLDYDMGEIDFEKAAVEDILDHNLEDIYVTHALFEKFKITI